MTGIFAITLITHIIAGLIGFIATYAILMALFRKKSSIKILRISSTLAFISYFVSWVSGGYYYVLKYGADVKPVIKSGDNAWAHSFFMETKEHVFLLLPVLTFILATIFFLRGEDVVSDGKMKQAVIYITILAALLALFITVSGVVISGSA